MENINEVLAENLATLRKANKYTQAEFAQKINYSDKTVSKWETGEAIPGVEVLYRIAQLYNVTIDDLLKADIYINKKEVNNKQYSHLVIALLSISCVWIIATLLFVYASLIHIDVPWLVFIFAVPISAIVALVFNSIWGNTRFNYAIISVLSWSLLGAFYLTFLEYHLWLIFLIGVPIQLAIILWSQLKVIHRRRKNTSEHSTSNNSSTDQPQ